MWCTHVISGDLSGIFKEILLHNFLINIVFNSLYLTAFSLNF